MSSHDAPTTDPISSWPCAMPMQLEQALALPGVALWPVVSALEAVGLEPIVALREAGTVDPYHLTVLGTVGPGWVLAREDLETPWYGRPLCGPCPWGFGAAPRGADLAAHLLELLGVGGGR
jgi:hypothetical protein